MCPAQSDNQPELITLENWPAGGINQSSRRSSIGNDDCWWLENLFPIANGELRSAWGPSPPIYTAPAGVSILRIFCANIDGTNPQGFMFRSDGYVDSVDLHSGAVVSLGQVWQPVAPHYWADLKLWRPNWFGSQPGEQGGVVIGSPQGLYAWDGTTLTSPGQQPPLWLTDGATTDASGNPLVMPSGLPGIYALEVYKQRLWVMGQTVISFSGPSNGADFSASGGGGSFGYFGDQLTVSYTDLAHTAGFLYVFGDSCTDWISNPQLLGAAKSTTTIAIPGVYQPMTTEFSYSNYNPQIGQRFFRSVGAWLQALAVFDRAGAYIVSGDSQMVWLTQKVTNTWDTLDATPFEPTCAPVHVFGQRWLLFNGRFTDPWGITRSMMFCWNGQIWTVASQGLELTHITHYEQNSCIDAYGTDGTSFYKLFAQPDTHLIKRLSTKAWTGPNAVTIKSWKRLYVQMHDNGAVPEGSFLTGTLTTSGGGLPNGSEQVSFEVQPGVSDVRPHPTAGQGIVAWLDLEGTSPDFTIERVMIAFDVRSIFGA